MKRFEKKKTIISFFIKSWWHIIKILIPICIPELNEPTKKLSIKNSLFFPCTKTI